MKNIAMCLLFGLAQAAGASQLVATPSVISNAPEVAITLVPGSGHHALRFHWRIKNTTAATVIIYTPFLRGPALDHRQDENGDVEIYTSLTAQLDVGVYYFPKAEFISLEPGASTEGEFSDPLKGGKWVKKGSKIALDVSYGYDLQTIQKALKEQFLHGRGHPANPLVEWQHFARSNVLLYQ